MTVFRRCCRPGCGKPAVATLTYSYAESTAVVGPLSPVDFPHAWDLCAAHAARTTAPRGWELVRLDLLPEDPAVPPVVGLEPAVESAGGVAPLPPEAEDGLDPAISRHPAHRAQAEAARPRPHRHLHLVDRPEG